MESRKRKPLSEISNTFDLIPTSTLRKIISSNSHSNSSFKPPISSLKPTSKFTYLDSSPVLNKTDVMSDTSVGSSSNVEYALNAGTVQLQNRKRPVSSLASLGVEESTKLYRRKQTTDTLKNQRESATVIDSSTPVSLVKRNDEGEAIAIPWSPPFMGKEMDARNLLTERCSTEKIMDGDMVDVSFLQESSEKVKEFEKGIHNFSSCSNGKMQNGKTVVNYLSYAKEKIEEKGKVFCSPSNWLHDEIEEEGKVIIELPGSSVQKAKDPRKTSEHISSFQVEKTGEKGKLLNSFGGLHDKTRDKGKTICQSPDIVEITDKRLTATALVNCRQVRRKFDKRNEDVGASSCPPMQRTKYIAYNPEDAGVVGSSKSWTAPPPKSRKKRYHLPTSVDESCLPPDFIKQQRAYFKEVDDFVLAEEEISPGELD